MRIADIGTFLDNLRHTQLPPLLLADPNVSDVLQGINNGTTGLIGAASPSAASTFASAGNTVGALARTGRN